MREPVRRSTAPRSGSIDAALLRELERQSTGDVCQLRAHERHAFHGSIVIRPSNSSEVAGLPAQGTTLDISAGGCRAIFSVAVGVGDVYRLTFDRAELDVPLVFARCLRCSLLRENAFETAFSFFTPIRLADSGITTSPAP